MPTPSEVSETETQKPPLTVASPVEDIRDLFPNAHDRAHRRREDDWEWEADCVAAPHQSTGPQNKVVGRYDAADGRHVLHCIAGCTPAALAEAVGLTNADVKFPLTVHELSRAFALPEDYLRGWGFSDVSLPQKCVAIAHRTAAGESVNQLRNRLKDNPNAKNRFGKRFYVQPGSVLPAFGGDRLGDATEAVFVEGSSDVVTLAFCGYIALGIAGQTNAKAIQAEHVSRLTTIFVFHEPGAQFVGHVARRLAKLNWRGQLLVISSDQVSAKDPAALWQRIRAEEPDDATAHARFRATFDAARAAAVAPTDEILAETGEYRNPTLVAELNRELAVLHEPAGLLLYERRRFGRLVEPLAVVCRDDVLEAFSVRAHQPTSTPIERAVPATIFIAASISFALRSGIFACAISRTCAGVSLPILFRFGSFEPDSTFSARLIRNDAGGVLVMNVNVRSSKTVISTGMMKPSWALVRSLYCLQKSMMLSE